RRGGAGRGRGRDRPAARGLDHRRHLGRPLHPRPVPGSGTGPGRPDHAPDRRAGSDRRAGGPDRRLSPGDRDGVRAAVKINRPPMSHRGAASRHGGEARSRARRPMMTQRLNNPFKTSPQTYQAMIGFSQAIADSGLERSLIELVKIRVSQINGCAYCIHMHTTEARKAGETEMRLHLLAAWRESSAFTARERAALAWAEALTRVEQTQAP